jgi:hypothetical protein
MPNYQPANNVVAGIVAGAVVSIGQHYLAPYGLNLSADASAGLTLSVSMGVTHLWDVITGDNGMPRQTDEPLAVPPLPKNDRP